MVLTLWWTRDLWGLCFWVEHVEVFVRTHWHTNVTPSRDPTIIILSISLVRTCHGYFFFWKAKVRICLHKVQNSGIPYEILVKIAEQKGMTLLISMVPVLSVDESEGTSYGSSDINMKGSRPFHDNSNTNPGSGRVSGHFQTRMSKIIRISHQIFWWR